MPELAGNLPPKFDKLVGVMISIKLTISAVAMLILPVTFFFVVIFRYIFELDLFAYEEWLLPISFWLYFMASAVGSYQGKQIRADILESYFKSPKANWIRRVIVSCIELFISLAVVYWALLMIIGEFQAYPYWQNTIVLKIPFLVPRLGIFLGFLFMAFYGFLHLYVLLKLGVQVVENERISNSNGAK